MSSSKKTFIRKSKRKKQVQQPDAAMQRDLDMDKREHVKEAREQADTDIARDADLSIHSPNDDLDEGESARLGEDETDIA
jgi:hypothetical protein